jgi:hypothetical protein
MKIAFVLFVLSLILGQKSFAGEPSSHCQKAALRVVHYLDELGWGALKETELKILSSSNDGVHEVIRAQSLNSGMTYTVQMEANSNSLSCVVLSVATDPLPQTTDTIRD